MLLCMRTTLDLDDALAIEAKKAAVDRRCSLRALVHEGLRLVLHGDARVAAGEKALNALRGRHGSVWEGTDPDEYVRSAREGWE